MSTLKLTILPDKAAKDGTHKIRVAIGHKSVTKYIVTKFSIKSANHFKNGQVVRCPEASQINIQLRQLLNDYQARLDAISNANFYNCGQLREMLMRQEQKNSLSTFQAVCAKYIEELKEEKRDNYAKLLDRNCKYFTRFAKGDILLDDISEQTIELYKKWLRKNTDAGDTTICMHLSRTRTIINKAVKWKLVRYDEHPFLNVKVASSAVKDVEISLHSINKIRTCDIKERKFVVARDLFMLSFYLGGINLIDLLSIDFRKKEKIEYIRTKVRNTQQSRNIVSLSIHDEAMIIIKKWMNRYTGKLDFGYKYTYQNFSRYISRTLKQLCKMIDISEDVVFTSARKTFSQMASELGIPDGIIDYVLGHSDKSRGIIRYYTKVRQKQADIAVQRVVDYINNPAAYKEYIELRADIMMMK